MSVSFVPVSPSLVCVRMQESCKIEFQANKSPLPLEKVSKGYIVGIWGLTVIGRMPSRFIPAQMAS